MLTKLNDGSYINLGKFNMLSVKESHYKPKTYSIYGGTLDNDYTIGKSYSTKQEAQKELDLLMVKYSSSSEGNVTRDSVIEFLCGLTEVEVRDIYNIVIDKLYPLQTVSLNSNYINEVSE